MRRRSIRWSLLLTLGLALLQRVEATTLTNIVLWDTGARFGVAEPESVTVAAAVDGQNRAGWIAVPSELFGFEADPPKAASDPGYYGREYSFKGDAVVETANLTAVFWARKGRVALYSKGKLKSEAPGSGNRTASAQAFAGEAAVFPGKEILEFDPGLAKAGKITRCEIVRNASDEVVLEVAFSAPGSAEVSVQFSFGRNEIVEIKPSETMRGLRLVSPIEYGIVPGFVGDDLIFAGGEQGSGEMLWLPAENVFVGLLKGEEREWVMTWPKGKQQFKLRRANAPHGKRIIESVDFDADGQSIYLGVVSAPGIWHREDLKPAYLEKDVPVAWKRPFPAKWKTQLIEAGVKTTFAFREAEGEIWRGVPGSYEYPVWFGGEQAFYHLSKKVPPKGESIVYFLEGQNTPRTVLTPVDVIKATLGLQMSEAMLDVAGQKLRTHHRRGGDGVHRACTCGCTEAIQAMFEKGQESERKNDVQEALGDMNYFVQCHVARIEEYRRFAGEMEQFLQAKSTTAPELKPYLESLQGIVRQIPEEYEVQKENMKSPQHAEELTRRTMALTGSQSTNHLTAYMELLKEWRAMGGAQDYLVAQCHLLTRKLFQEAGMGCVNDPNAVVVAQEVRARCRRVLRNPDGYEIWANY